MLLLASWYVPAPIDITEDSDQESFEEERSAMGQGKNEENSEKGVCQEEIVERHGITLSE